MIHDDSRERLTRLEVEVKNLEEKLTDACDKIDKMYDAFVQAKGARYVLAAAAALAGGIAGFMVKIIPFSNGLPK